MNVLLDVGAHNGQTVQIALDKKYGFDKLYAFEPVPECCENIRKIEDDRVVVCNFGFWNKNCTKDLYNPGSKGASVYKDKFNHPVGSRQIELIKISEWFT